MAIAAVAAGLAAGRGGCRRDPGGVDALVRRFAGPRRRSGAVVAVDLGGTDRARSDRRGARLAQQPVAAPHGDAGGGAAVSAQRRGGAEPLGRIFPDGSGGLERSDRGAVARRNRSPDGHGDARQGCSGARSARSGDDPRRRLALQTPHRVRVPPACLVRARRIPAARGDDDRRRVQHPGGLATHRKRDRHHRRLRRGARRQRPGVRVRRRRGVVQQRHRMRQRAPRQGGRPPHRGRAAVCGFHLRCPQRRLGRPWAGRWAAPARWT